MSGRFVFLFSIFFLPFLAKAAQWATVINTGAQVYKNASFDAPVISYLSLNQRIRISSKTFGPFYRVKLPQGKLGYISDIDVKPENGLSVEERSFKSRQEKDPFSRKPIFGNTYLGLIVGMVNYQDEISNFVGSSNVIMFGPKFSTPLEMVNGVFTLDATLLFGIDTPDMYDQICLQCEASGNLVVSDVQLQFSLLDFNDRSMSIFIGTGPFLSYSDVKVVQEVNGILSEVPLQSARIGGSLTLGLGIRLGDFALKLEPKYIIEQLSYFSFQAAFQYQL